MENKINLVELLKDCPNGMELDCTVYDNVTFDKVSDDKKSVYPIFCLITDEKGNRSGISFTENGYVSRRYGAKCVIFPKGKTTWKDFQIPFKDGDIAVDTLGGIHIMQNSTTSYCYFDRLGILDKSKTTCVRVERLATEEEKEKLFKAIKDNGYKWNEKTKALEKLPKFKVGNIIQDKTGYKVKITEVNIEDECYGYESLTVNGIGGISFDRQDDWELVPDKFDINTLKTFDSRVLVRDRNNDEWRGQFFSHYYNSSDRPYICIGVEGLCEYKQCIPYEQNKHLLGTTNDCDEFYKTW